MRIKRERDRESALVRGGGGRGKENSVCERDCQRQRESESQRSYDKGEPRHEGGTGNDVGERCRSREKEIRVHVEKKAERLHITIIMASTWSAGGSAIFVAARPRHMPPPANPRPPPHRDHAAAVIKPDYQICSVTSLSSTKAPRLGFPLLGLLPRQFSSSVDDKESPHMACAPAQISRHPSPSSEGRRRRPNNREP